MKKNWLDRSLSLFGARLFRFGHSLQMSLTCCWTLPTILWTFLHIIWSSGCHVYMFWTFVSDRWESAEWLGGALGVIKEYCWKNFGSLFEHFLDILWSFQDPPKSHLGPLLRGPPWCDKGGGGRVQESSQMWCPAPSKQRFLGTYKVFESFVFPPLW